MRVIFLGMRRGTDKFKPALTFSGTRLRECDHPDCHVAAEHRAPKSRELLGDYFWFCLDHVRVYNKSWNFCAGLGADEIETEIREDTVWRRPTWPMGSAEGDRRWRFVRDADFSDGFGAFWGKSQAREEPAGAHRPPLKSPEGKAFSILGLDPSASLSELKARYKELVKTHHPDRNGGDKLAEEKLKDINDAYSTLRKCVTA